MNPFGIGATGYACDTNSFRVVSNCFAVEKNQTLATLSADGAKFARLGLMVAVY